MREPLEPKLKRRAAPSKDEQANKSKPRPHRPGVFVFAMSGSVICHKLTSVSYRHIFLSPSPRGGRSCRDAFRNGRRCGACGLEGNVPSAPGRRRAPPAGTMTRREELADGAGLGRPLSNQRHAKGLSSEARPGAGKTPQRSAERRPRRANAVRHDRIPAAPFGAPFPLMIEGTRPRKSGARLRRPPRRKEQGR
jgi:hypothetical protein